MFRFRLFPTLLCREAFFLLFIFLKNYKKKKKEIKYDKIKLGEPQNIHFRTRHEQFQFYNDKYNIYIYYGVINNIIFRI